MDTGTVLLLGAVGLAFLKRARAGPAATLTSGGAAVPPATVVGDPVSAITHAIAQATPQAGLTGAQATEALHGAVGAVQQRVAAGQTSTAADILKTTEQAIGYAKKGLKAAAITSQLLNPTSEIPLDQPQAAIAIDLPPSDLIPTGTPTPISTDVPTEVLPSGEVINPETGEVLVSAPSSIAPTGDAADLLGFVNSTPAEQAAELAAIPGGENAAAAVASGEASIVPAADVATEIGSDTVAAGTASTTGSLLPSLATTMQVLGVAGLAVDIGFTIASNKPDAMKAIDTALDAAAIAALMVPVYGWIAAIVIEIVKFIFDMFGGGLFSSGLSHAQREQLEAARYGANLQPMLPEMVNSLTPRELLKVLISWTSGYCGGVHNIAMGMNVKLKAGDQLMVGGKLVTIPHYLPSENYYGDGTSMILGIGSNEPTRCYWLGVGYPDPVNSGFFKDISNDEQAWALAVYGWENGIVADAQAGIAETLKAQFNGPTAQTCVNRCKTFHDLIRRGYTLDGIDFLASEFRLKPHLDALAAFYQAKDWKVMFGALLQSDWSKWLPGHKNGTVTDFARSLGYASPVALRAAIFKPLEDLMAQLQGLSAQADQVVAAATILSVPVDVAPSYTDPGIIVMSGGNGA